MTQEQEQLVSYQWIKGERIGSVEEIDKEENGFTYFKSGRRVKTELMGEFLMEALDGTIPIQEDIETKSDPTTGLATAGAVDPAAGLSVAGSSPAVITQPKASNDSAVMSLLKKMGDSAKDTIEISLKMSVKIPKKGTFTILEESFGEEVIENIESLALSQIDEKKVQEELKESLKGRVNKYYK